MEHEKKQSEAEKSRKPHERTSKAAQVAQRRREEKKERVRLENLREKQTRKSRRRNKVRKRISRTTLKRILIMVGVALALILSMIIFFRVRHIEVQGSSYYQPEEIINAAGVEEGDNLLIISRGDIAGNVMAKLPYVASVRVTRQLPDTVMITVTEYEATYAVIDARGEYYLITAGGKATEKISAAKAAEHILIEDLTIVTPTIGEQISVMAPAGQEIAAQGQLAALKEVLMSIEESDLLQKIRSVSVPSSYEISLWYEDRFLVQIGDAQNLSYKMSFLKTAVEEQKIYATGTIDLTQAAEKKVIVSLNEE